MNWRVLVVEDNQDTRDLLVFALVRDGYRVVEADSLAEGLGALQQDSAVDLVISDFSLGDGDGLDMVDRARREGVLGGQPIIIWTAHPHVRAPEPILVLEKPLGTDELLLAARRLLVAYASHRDPPGGARDDATTGRGGAGEASGPRA